MKFSQYNFQFLWSMETYSVGCIDKAGHNIEKYMFKMLFFIVSLNLVTYLLVCIIYFSVSVIFIWIFFSIFFMKIIFYLINTFVLKLLMLSKCLKVLIWGRFKNSLIYIIKDLILCPLHTVCNFACIYVIYMCIPVLRMSDLCVSVI